MRQTTFISRRRVVDGEIVPAQMIDRWVCARSHPHPTSSGAEACETAMANGATDAELLALFELEVAAFNAS